MNEPCKTCESREFTTENYERICISCGDVQEEFEDEGRLCMVPDSEAVLDRHRNKNYEANQRLTSRIRGEANSTDAKRHICREKLLTEMRKIVKQLIKHPAAVNETMELVSSSLKAHEGRLLHAKKLGLVGACIYYLSAKHQLGISLADICKVTNIKMKVISGCLKQVRQLCPEFEYERPNIKDLVKKYIDEIATKHYDQVSLDYLLQTKSSSFIENTSLSSQPLIDLKDRIVIQNRVMLLMDLFEAMHPYNQPAPQSLITAVIYHAWRSLDTFKVIAVNLSSSAHDIPAANTTPPDNTQDSEAQSLSKNLTKIKHLISFEKFCQMCNLRYSSSGHKIVSKLQSSLLMLGKYLGNVNKLNLPWYLEEIIKNYPHLIQEHLRTENT